MSHPHLYQTVLISFATQSHYSLIKSSSHIRRSHQVVLSSTSNAVTSSNHIIHSFIQPLAHSLHHFKVLPSYHTAKTKSLVVYYHAAPAQSIPFPHCSKAFIHYCNGLFDRFRWLPPKI